MSSAATRVGIKFNPPTLGIEYQKTADAEKEALKVVLTEHLADIGPNAGESEARLILDVLSKTYPDVINKSVVSMPQVLRLLGVLVDKAKAAKAAAPTAATAVPPVPGVGVSSAIVVGSTIKAKMSNWRTAYSGTVLATNDDGTYDVKFEDGEVVKKLASKWIIDEAGSAPAASQEPLVIKVGGTLKAKMGNWRTAYTGTVLAINEDGTFEVKFEDGEVVKKLAKKWIIGGATAVVEKPTSAVVEKPTSAVVEKPTSAVVEKPQAATAGSTPIVIKTGGRIEAKLSNWRQAYGGTVKAINADGTFHVVFDDGEELKYLQKKWIIGGETAVVESEKDTVGDALVIKVGATIKAKLGSWKQAYSGTVLGINGDGTFHVKFEDGEEMKYLQKKWILGGDTAIIQSSDAPSVSSGAASDDDNVLRKGKVIQAKLPNWSKPYNGEVMGVNTDGTIHVKFEDGDEMKYLQKKWVIGGDKMTVQQSGGNNSGGFTAPDGTKFTDRNKYRQYVMKTEFTFEKLTGKRGTDALVKAPGSVNGEPFDMIDLDDCEAAMLGWASQVQVDRCKNSKILVGPVESSIFVRDCKDCEFTIACRQLRTRDCTNCVFHLLSCTDPIIERSTGLTITPYNGAWHGQTSHFEAAKLDPNDNHWRLVFDFNKNGKDNYGVPDPHFELKEGDPGEWRFDVKGTLGDLPCENPVPTDAIATSVSEGGQGHGGAAESIMKEMVKEKSDPTAKPVESKKPWAWVKEPDRAQIKVGLECRVTFARDEGVAVRNSSFYEGVVLGVNADKTFHVKYEDGDEEKDLEIKFIQIRKWD